MKTHINRYEEIAETLVRHGLGFAVSVMGIERWVPLHHGALGHERREEPYTEPEHLRLAFEELGPTFIKLGQLLSTRSDILPPDFVTELAKLQDAAPPVAEGAIMEIIRQELGAEAEEIYRFFESVPLASASIGQAHRATLHDGTRVVVKVRRPGVVEQIDVDLQIMQNLAAHASRRWVAASDYNLIGLVDEFTESLRGELDYLREGRNAERFAENFDGSQDVQIPKIYWDTTTSRVLTLDEMTGWKVTDIASLSLAGIDRPKIARRGADIILKMIFEDGFFHADPHPGNLFVQSDERIGLIDFGMVGEVSNRLRDQLSILLVALAGKDADAIGAALLDLSVVTQSVDRDTLREDLNRFVELYADRSLDQIDIPKLITHMLSILRTYHLQLPREMVMVLKVLLMTEGMGVELDPGFNLGEVLKPYTRRLVRDQLSLSAIAGKLARASSDAAHLIVDLPEKLRRFVDLIDTAGIEVHLRAAELEPLVGRVERIGNRLVAGMIVAAFINGIGELAAGDRRWRSRKMPWMSVGVGAASVLSAYLAWTSQRRRGR
ncbi:AarF/ABC1/UbiB kinase family protein [Cryobacterium glaciale]|uniref:AarF/ABC1/UbiB kinase family protein n=1 Tax=Cryobacterium glaciale TaxID=1259145 RepID=A0A4R8UVJ5_9MICO|nr:AarF/ABC1/UbiB kinase family protein [Cryobacterium glaciale]TFB71571.1 AarF/ABC1/UbiB kinase family protein [Cryobacterium glaciale]